MRTIKDVTGQQLSIDYFTGKSLEEEDISAFFPHCRYLFSFSIKKA